MAKKSLLFVSARVPYPAKEGHQLRTLGLLEQLSAHYDVHLLSILRPGETVEHAYLKHLCKTVQGVSIDLNLVGNIIAGLRSVMFNKPLVVTRYVTSDLVSAFCDALDEFEPERVHLDLLPLMELAKQVKPGVKVVLNQHNVESVLIGQKIDTLSGTLSRIIYKREHRLLDRFERRSCQRADVVLACSDLDRDVLSKMGADSAHTIPNGVDTRKFEPNSEDVDPNKLVFLGGMGWYPNRLGMQWFVDEVLPLIVKQNTSIHVDVIGNPEPRISIPETLAAYITLHGFVDDFRPLVAKAGMMIVPLNVGSGTRLKVVEGAALGKCMVSTSKGAEGVNLDPARDIILADSAKDFAEQILSLTVDEDRIVNIGRSAREVAETKYDWRVIGEKLFDIYEGGYV